MTKKRLRDCWSLGHSIELRLPRSSGAEAGYSDFVNAARRRLFCFRPAVAGPLEFTLPVRLCAGVLAPLFAGEPSIQSDAKPPARPIRRYFQLHVAFTALALRQARATVFSPVHIRA